ncbi:MAG: PKD domain-containing protein [Candidatus Cloacimonetes bacterium]|nr:PKD domain-containing protein [Candidatus Cloacimonadota bacterium]
MAKFQADQTLGIAPFQVNFADVSVGNVEIWQWDFENDGTIDSYEQNPSHIYESSGIYSVSLTVIDGNYFDREIHHSMIRIGEEFITDFEANTVEGVLPLEVQFTDISIGGLLNQANNSKIQMRDIIYWEWDFDSDGTVDSHEQNPTYIFEDSGTYSVALTVSDGTFYDTETKIDFIEVKEPEIESTSLSNNFPNPFSDKTVINFSLKTDSFVELIIFNLKGQIVRKLVNNSLVKGHYTKDWDGKDQNANDVQSGMFFYSLKCNNRIISTRKMVFMR